MSRPGKNGRLGTRGATRFTTALQQAFEKVGWTSSKSPPAPKHEASTTAGPAGKVEEELRVGKRKGAEQSASVPRRSAQAEKQQVPNPRKRNSVPADAKPISKQHRRRPQKPSLPTATRKTTGTTPIKANQRKRTEKEDLLEQAWRDRMRQTPELLERRLVEAASHVAPCQEELRELSLRLEDVPANGPGGREVEAVLGVDFGTSSTKIVARMPYESGQPTVAVTVPAFARAEEHPHLWASRLWLARNGQFSLVPEEGASLFCGLKAALMSERPESRLVMHVSEMGATALEAAAAFLALQMRQARGWLLINRSEFSRQRIRWQYNIGFPAASLDDERLATVYRRCCAAALALSLHDAPLTVGLVREAVCRVECEDLAELGIGLIAEIAAAVTGFAHSTQRDDELYTMIDVGATTLDSCTFNLRDPENEMKCSIFVAQVRRLGVQPLECWAGDLEFEQHFEDQVSLSLRSVLWTTRTRRYPGSQRWKQEMPIFLIGGGSASELHRRAVDGLDPWLRRYLEDSGGAEVRGVSAPENLIHESPPSTIHRLTVAIGLSYPFFEIPQIMLPNEIEDAVPLARRTYEHAYIGKELV